MSNISHIIEERAHDLGNFLVGRLLPFRGKRMVGPFIFIDHMGPVTLGVGERFDVAPHPHIGLSTLTYLFEGHILHRDSSGVVQEISPGAVNWMTAGRGIVHSERMPERLLDQEKTLHGLQIWVALPKDKEQMMPNFEHVEAEALPRWERGGVQYKLIAGEVMGKTAPVKGYSPLYLLELRTGEAGAVVDIGDELYGEVGMYILSGEVGLEGQTHAPKRLIVAKESFSCQFSLLPHTTIYLFGGQPLAEERFIYWNFVASDRALIEAAKQSWVAQTFPKIEGETEFIPLPKI